MEKFSVVKRTIIETENTRSPIFTVKKYLFGALLIFPILGISSEIPDCPDNLEKIYEEHPKYPRRHTPRPVEGWVRIQGKLNPDGRLEDLLVLEAEPTDFFEKSALDAAGTWRFNWAGSWCMYTTTVHYLMAK